MQQSLLRLSAALQRRMTPGLRYSQDEYEDVLRARADGVARWLDLGCGHRVLPEWRESAEKAIVGRAGLVVGIDYDLPSLARHRSLRRVARADASRLPFADGTFDLVTANMVVEHLDDPEAQFREVARVLRPGGAFLFHTPNDRSYIVRAARLLPDGVKKVAARILDGREGDDVFPTHYRVNRPERIAAVAAAAGLGVDELKMIRTSPVFNVVPPLLVPELLWVRALASPRLAGQRPDIICVLRKAAGATAFRSARPRPVAPAPGTAPGAHATPATG
jgi:SAM-dependent methyltransferase